MPRPAPPKEIDSFAAVGGRNSTGKVNCAVHLSSIRALAAEHKR